MQKRMRMLGVMLIAITGLVCGGSLSATAAPGTTGANVAQADRVSPWTCAASAPSPLTFTNIPDAPTFWGGAKASSSSP